MTRQRRLQGVCGWRERVGFVISTCSTAAASCFYMLYAVDQRAILPCDCDNYGNSHGELGVNSMFCAGCGGLCRFGFVHCYCINVVVILTWCFVWSSSCFYRAEYHVLCDTASKFSMFLIILFDYIFLNLFLSLCCYCCAASPSHWSPQIPFTSMTCCKKKPAIF